MLLPLLLSFFSLFAEARTKDLFCNADLCTIPFDAEGNQNGTEICYADEAKTIKLKEVSWKNGKREGVARCWEKGKVSQEAEYRSDALNGLFIEYKYDSTGHLVNLMENNEATGLQFSVDDAGKVTRIHYCLIGDTAEPAAILSCRDQNYGKYNTALADFRKAQFEKDKLAAEKEAKRKNGPQETKYASGAVRAKWTNVNGEMHGKFVSWREDGKVLTDCSYQNGDLEGPCLEYDEAGRLDSRKTYAKNKVVKEEVFYDNGKTSILIAKEGDRYCTTEFYESGPKSHTYCLSGDYRRWYAPIDGPYNFWFENGKQSLKGQFQNGRPSGHWESFEENGELYREAWYENGTLTKTIDYFRKAPQHRIVRELFPDGSVRTETRLEGLEGNKSQVI